MWKGSAECQCTVMTGYSAGKKPCQPMKQTDGNQIISSRCSEKRNIARFPNLFLETYQR